MVSRYILVYRLVIKNETQLMQGVRTHFQQFSAIFMAIYDVLFILINSMQANLISYHSEHIWTQKSLLTQSHIISIRSIRQLHMQREVHEMIELSFLSHWKTLFMKGTVKECTSKLKQIFQHSLVIYCKILTLKRFLCLMINMISSAEKAPNNLIIISI